jgi:hypothetical protein
MATFSRNERAVGVSGFIAGSRRSRLVKVVCRDTSKQSAAAASGLLQSNCAVVLTGQARKPIAYWLLYPKRW